MLSKTERKVILLVQKLPYNKELLKELRCSKALISMTTKSLSRKGLLKSIKFFNLKKWELTQKGKDLVQSLFSGDESNSRELVERSHGFIVKLKITRDLKEWEGKALQTSWTMHYMRNWTAFRKDYGDVQVLRTPKHFMFSFEGVIGVAEFSTAYFLRRADEVKLRLESEYAGLVLGTPEVVNEIVRQHHAIQFDPLAMEYKKNSLATGKSMTYQSDKLHIDESKGVPETETVGKASALDDLRKIKSTRTHFSEDELLKITGGLYEDVIRSDMSWADAEKAIKNLAINLEKAANDQKFYAENMVSHVKAIQVLGDAVKSLKDEVVKLKKPKRTYQRRFKGKPYYVG